MKTWKTNGSVAGKLSQDRTNIIEKVCVKILGLIIFVNEKMLKTIFIYVHVSL